MFEEEEHPMTWEDYRHARDHLQGIINQVYHSGSMEDLETNLEEIAACFGMRVPRSEPILQLKPTELEQQKDRLFKTYAGYTRAYAEFLSGSKGEKYEYSSTNTK